MRTAPTVAAVLFAVSVCVFLGSGLIRASSPTYDEPVHLAAGYTDLATGRVRLNANDHPPLGEMWAALPLLAMGPERFSSHPAWIDGAVYHFGDLFLYHNRIPAARLLGTARLWNLATLTALVACALVLWARRLDGDLAAAGAAFALAFCVPWFSNAALVTTDAPSAALFFAACAAFAVGGRTPRALAAGGALAGAALAAKFNMILLPPLAFCAFAAEARADAKRRPGAAAVAAAVVAALLALAAAYRFRDAGLYASGLSATLSRLSEGRSAYLLGAHSSTGWWWYFPAAFLVKTPLPLLALGLFGAVIALRRPRAEAAWLLIPPVGYFVAALTSKTQIGYRHLLPVYPFLCLWAGLGAAALWRRGGAARACLAGGLVWLGASVSGNHPRHLAYFNELALGRGDRWLSDSNLDWGQDLPALAAALAARGNPPTALSYFGSGDPDAYGIRYAPVAVVSNVERAGNAALTPGGPVLFAVSETNRVGTYYRDPELLGWLRTRVPVATPGGSISLYDLTADADGRARLAALLAAQGRAADAAAVAGKPAR